MQKLNISCGNHYLIGLDKSAVDKLVLKYVSDKWHWFTVSASYKACFCAHFLL